TWIAPDADAGRVTFYAASCTIDDNSFETGDHVQLSQVSAVFAARGNAPPAT
ncbi:MAG: hypothetical protein IT449_19075, partial [Phycisphaerales bacterium]|nr:hypothetical protein [Phycisphaerales bacterium]